MLNNFSSSIISGIGISLGCIDTSIDLLNSDEKLYDAEINEIKKNSLECDSLADIQYVKPLTIKRPIKPKLSRESIIKKYKLQVISNEKHGNEEIIDLGFTDDTDDFDFSLEDTATDEGKVEDKSKSLAAMSNTNEQELASEDEDDSVEDQIDSIDEDDIDIDEDEDDSEDEDEDDIDNIDVDDADEDDIDIDEDDSEDEDDIDIDEDEDDSEDEDDIDIDEDEDDSEDEDDIDIDEDEDDSEDEDDIDIDIDEDGIGIDEEDIGINKNEDNTLNTESTHENIKSNNVGLAGRVDAGSAKAENKEQQTNAEIDELKQQIANMEKKLHDINSSKAPNTASDIYDDKLNKTACGNIDKITSNTKVGQTQQHNKKPVVCSQYEKYDNMSIEALYTEVSTYMKGLGVSRKTVDILTLNEEFGERNIRKLLQKSYLIKFGKGVTTGR